tara:strand:+ start:1120 stop:1293 length:174 start_codon:yes stop_codon:yes gene_type:complete
MKITSAQYFKRQDGSNGSIMATIDGEVMSVPIAEDNRHYIEIKKQVDARTLTIKDAD